MDAEQNPMDSQDILKMLQQKIGNLELTVHAMMNVLDDEDILDQERINEEAQAIVEEMKEVTDEDIEERIQQDEE